MQWLLYVSPALIDWMMFFVFFTVFYAAGVRGVGMQECGWLGVMFQVAYITSSFASGRFVTQHNARRALMASTVVCGVSSVALLCSHAFILLSVGLLVFGVSAAVFFNSFQAFMRGEASVGNLKTSVALYTLSWSLGAAVGNLTAGWLYRWGIPALIMAVVMATVVITVILARPGRSSATGHTADERVEHGGHPKYPVSGAYVIIGWLMIFTATFVQRPLFTFLPPYFAATGISSLWASLPLFMHLAVLAFFGLAMSRHRDFLYRRKPFLIIQTGGVAALCTMWLWPTYWVCFSMLCVLGVYGSFVYYCAVYYANNSGRRSFNIGMNEALVGVGSITGILLGDAWMRHSGSTKDMYLVCAAGLAVSVIAQIVVARRDVSAP